MRFLNELTLVPVHSRSISSTGRSFGGVANGGGGGGSGGWGVAIEPTE